MPTPNFSDPWLIQLLKQYGQRITNLESSFAGIKDANGITRVKWGILANGDYGISLTDIEGNTQELLPMVDDYVDGSITTTSTTPVDVTGSPSVSCVIGASGDFEVTFGSYIGVPDNCTGVVYLVIDGAADFSIVELGTSDTGGGIAGNVQSTRRWGPSGAGWSNAKGQPLLTPGPHTFTLQYKSTNGTTTFASQYLKIQPL